MDDTMKLITNNNSSWTSAENGHMANTTESHIMAVFELPRERNGLGTNPPPNCFLNPQHNPKFRTGGRGSAIYYIHTIYITILVRLRPSKKKWPSSSWYFTTQHRITTYI